VPLVSVNVVPRAKENVVNVRSGSLVVRVTVAAEDGKANERVIELLAEYWGIAKSRLRLVRGQRSRRKQIEVPIGVRHVG
jgi:uncharacterized protein (TIGR00251 family)